jgi:antitoxin HicB
MHPTRLAFPVDLGTDEDGRVVARVADVPGCVTDGATRYEALAEAADALEEAIAALMEARRDVPVPSAARGRPRVVPGAVMAAKVALYIALRETSTSNVALAQRLGVAETEVRRMIDPRHKTKIGRLEAGLAALGRRLVVSVEAA